MSQNVPNDVLAQMVAALQQVNENLHNLNQNPRSPSQFHGGFAPNAAIEWIQGVERIFRAMNYSEIQKLTYVTYMLVKEAKNRIYEDDLAADEAATPKVIPPKNFGPQRNFSHGKGKDKVFQEERKPYSPPTGSRRYTSHGPRTHANAVGSQSNSPSLCVKCGRTHVSDLFPRTTLSCFHYKEAGHIRRYCPKLRQSVNVVRAKRPRSTGRVFTMSGVEASDVDGLIKGNCMVAGIPLLVLFDSGATHSFVSVECVDRLKLQTESLPFDFTTWALAKATSE
ncbi:hypothetical protein Lal_00018832 [Lupinus albus]|nr:hypothetical protein Lal_00018832 [Lupinus albus]